MSKCHVREMSTFFRSLVKDCLSRYPTLGAELERDLNRLLGLVKSRGIGVFLRDLPAVGKHFDRCLANGEYKLSGLPLTKRFSNRVVIPKFLRGLYLLVFHDSGRLKDDYDPEAIFFIRQLTLTFKKAQLDCSDEAVHDEVVEFFAVDRSLPEPERFWSSETVSSQDAIKEAYHGYGKSSLYRARLAALDTRKRIRLSTFLTKLDFVSNLVTTTLGSYDPSAWRFKHGPGAVSEVTGPSNKYCWKNWSDSLERDFPIADYGFHSYASWADRAYRDEIKGAQAPYSRMVAVPKSFSKPRLIAAEPSEHQWCQQNLWHYFSRRSRASWISAFVRFNDQSLNQELCSLGSRTGTLATVDLSAASDRVTCHFVGQFFRSNSKVLSSLRACRTHHVKQLLTPRVPELFDLRKFSTMGNACTFPVESLSFLAIALAAVLTERGIECKRENVIDLEGEVAVFGDDIVIPVDSRELLVEALEILDFKVNDSKSFWTGKFRESCGVDSYDGVNVTPVYWKTFYDGGPESLASVMETSNNLYNRYLLNASNQLAWTLPRQLPVVDVRSGVMGLKSRTPASNCHLRKRDNPLLQRDEVQVVSLTTKQHYTPVHDDSVLLQFFTEVPNLPLNWDEKSAPRQKWQSGVPQRPQLKRRLRWVPVDDLYYSK
nr:MAG: RNA dependent RNA polymerase [Leviviridae sp.]